MPTQRTRSRSAPRGQVFVLSPATAHGKKGRVLLENPARTPVAKQLRTEGMPIGAVFRYLSGLYFNGKLAYARTFARPPRDRKGVGDGVFIITMTDGLVTPDTAITAADLERYASAEFGSDAGRDALTTSVRELTDAMGDECDVVFLGSVSGGKYTDILSPILGERLLFPRELLNRGQLDRGALLLRCVLEERELSYEPLASLKAEPKTPRVTKARKRVGAAEVILSRGLARINADVLLADPTFREMPQPPAR